MISDYCNKEAVRVKLGVDIEGLENEHGKVKVNFTDGSELYDRVIYAIGGTTPKDFLKSCGITLDESGEPIFDENYETEVEGLYIAGDIAFNSGGSIAIALNHGYRIVNHILSKEK
jgi:thioredoxin reductase (NADPH)